MAEEILLTECPILNLPLDILLSICEYLEDRDILKLGRTCYTFYEITQNNFVWRVLSLQRWGFCNIQSTPSCNFRWKSYYSKRRTVEVKMDGGRSGNFQVKTLRGHDELITGSLYVKLGANAEIDEFKLSNVVSAADDGTVRLWDVDSKKCISLCKIDSPVKCIVNSPDMSEIIAGDEMGRITRLKLPSLEIVKGHETNSPIFSLQYIKSCVKGNCDLFLSAHKDGSVLFWKDFENNDTVDPYRTVHTGGYYPDGGKDQLKILVNANQTKVVIFASDKDDLDVLDFAKTSTECTEAECLITRLLLADHVLDGGWIKVSKTPLFICLSFGQISLFEIDNSKNMLGQWIHPIDKYSFHNFSCLSMCPGHDFIVGGRDGEVQQYTINSKNKIELIKQFHDHKGYVNAVFATSYRVMSCSDDFSIRVYVWKKEGGRKVLESRYTLLGGSLALNPFPRLTHVVHDQVSCVGTNGKLLKVYVFQD
ncbi:F-box/WD repeat-containing protein 12 isoform X1 [Oopsacas minuta]|uniref:F-box/WD repeat-containing protein 12 isoform X1 n=1 Tax=Oopsacas minuta TaxID=111878 RepID=A0AAV7KKI2_9METZ|nr:F-box/WD repeat-containing protein 12 isoform X1 [Oopsacas minuta]